MSVTTDVLVRPTRWNYREIESGVSLFSAQGAVTGAAGAGTQTVRFQTDPDSSDDYRQYVAITRATVHSTTAALNDNVSVRTTAGDFDRGITYQIPICLLEPKVTETSLSEMHGFWYGFVNLGRVEAGKTGTINVVAQEVNGCVMEITLEGILSDHAITGRWWLSA